jgi:hypothetical protein
MFPAAAENEKRPVSVAGNAPPHADWVNELIRQRIDAIIAKHKRSSPSLPRIPLPPVGPKPR